MNKWTKRFIAIAHEVATWSKDPKCQVGCVIVSPDKRQFTVGYNGFPKGIKDLDGRLADQVYKNSITVHAELNAILNAGTNLEGWTLYTTKPLCVNCAAAVIQAGIKDIVMPNVAENSDWKAENDAGYLLLVETGSKIIRYDVLYSSPDKHI